MTYTLRLFVPNDNEILYNLYSEKVNQHNQMVLNSPNPDSGFDLFVPEEITLVAHRVNKIGFKVKCEMVQGEQRSSSAFYLYPRSSISKTNFRLANNVGIIDSGYRGEIIGMFDVVYSYDSIKCEKFKRILQICSPTLSPFMVELVKNDNELSYTDRGEGGIGSTGGVNVVV